MCAFAVVLFYYVQHARWSILGVIDKDPVAPAAAAASSDTLTAASTPSHAEEPAAMKPARADPGALPDGWEQFSDEEGDVRTCDQLMFAIVNIC